MRMSFGFFGSTFATCPFPRNTRLDIDPGPNPSTVAAMAAAAMTTAMMDLIFRCESENEVPRFETNFRENAFFGGAGTENKLCQCTQDEIFTRPMPRGVSKGLGCRIIDAGRYR